MKVALDEVRAVNPVEFILRTNECLRLVEIHKSSFSCRVRCQGQNMDVGQSEDVVDKERALFKGSCSTNFKTTVGEIGKRD